MAKRRFYRRIYQKGRGKKRIIFIFKVFAFCLFLFISGISFLFLYCGRDLPRPEDFNERELFQSTKIYDRTGKVLLYEIYGEEKRTWVDLEKMPDFLKNAVIATEDKNFYRHPGVDIKSVIRAVMIDLKLGQPIQGGSTITQQLIRSSFLSRQKTIKRKTREVILALELAHRYSKDQILEWYLNQIPLGSNCYGVESASKTFFKKSVSDLSLSEAATLAALIRAPSYLSPYGRHKDKLIIRRNYVLDRMVKEGYITEKQAAQAKKEKLIVNPVRQSIKAPHFVFYVRDYLVKKYGKEMIETKGFRVYTTLDWKLQKEAEEILKEEAKKNRAHNAYNDALVAINPKSGQILAMAGSADWYATSSLPEGCEPRVNCRFEPKFDIATLGRRQPGSAFKPFVYATAFQNGHSDKEIVIDEKTDFGVWNGKHYVPQNYDGKFRGPVTLREALAQSLNIPSIKVLINMAGISKSIENARKFGVATLNKPDSFYGPAIVLGGGEVRLLDMVSAYGVFATEGLRVPPVSILKIEDSQGNIIEKPEPTPRRVLEEGPARLINSILSDNEARAPLFGYHSALYFEDYQVAVKTGTTNDFRDFWAIGYTPSIVVGVWVGNNDNSPMRGSFLAAPVWRKFMLKVLPTLPKEAFTPIAPATEE